jgi:acyl-CoA synthetase (AMP-forming)/AMP-acid ligase II
MNIGTLVTRHALYRPEHLAFVFEDRRLTYRDFNSYVNRLSRAVLGAGLEKGDKFATLLPNCLELMALYWVAAKTGTVIVPLSTMLQAAGLKTLLRDSDSVLIFAAPASVELLTQIHGDLPQIPEDRVVLTGSGGAAPGGYRSLEAFMAEAGSDEPPDASLEDGDAFNIMYTSGTTGLPKGIVHTHYVRMNYCTIFASSFRMTPESVVLHAGSIVFNGAMIDLMPWMFLGCSYLLHASFDPAAVIRDIEREGVTHIVLVPAQIIAILNCPAFDPGRLGSLEMILSVGAPLHLEHKHRLNDVLPGRFYELYGLTEGFATVLDGRDALRKAGSVGVPPPFYELRIMGADGRPCGPGETGEIQGRSPVMMPGYYKRPDLTAETIVDGWLRTGDVGYVDEEGFLYLVDRLKDMIVSGGVNVYPRDIEEVVVEHPSVSEVAVFGVPDETWGEVPVAAVIPLAERSIDPAELIEWTNGRVGAKYQRIVDVAVMDDFPRNIAGKTLKRELRDRYTKSR